MLVSFRVENFRSFASEQEFSLVASPDDSLAETLIGCEKFDLLRSAVIFGANASGKSNLLKALEAVRNFVITSATAMNLGDPVPGMVPFRLDKQWREKPCRFEITALIDGARYEYGFSATATRVHSEFLDVCRPGGRLAKKFHRKWNPETGEPTWEFSGLGKKDEQFLREKTRPNGLLLSRAAELNFEAAGELFLWLKEGMWISDFSTLPLQLQLQTARQIKRDPTFRQRVLTFIRDADLGISDISVSGEPSSGLAEFMAEVVALGKQLGVESADELSARLFGVQTTHYDADGKPISFSLLKDESNGTQRYFAIVGPILSAIDRGATIIIDELECSMHPLLTRKIVELVNDPDANPRGAQLIFATHDSSLLDSSLFRRDQIWIAEKRQGGATELFSLYDFEGDEKPRKSEAFQKQYLAGRYGGVPSFGPVFEDLEVP